MKIDDSEISGLWFTKSQVNAQLTKLRNVRKKNDLTRTITSTM